MSGKTMSILGRQLGIDEYGFPYDISSFFAQEMTLLQNNPEPILESPINLEIIDNNNQKIGWTSKEYNIETEEYYDLFITSRCRETDSDVSRGFCRGISRKCLRVYRRDPSGFALRTRFWHFCTKI